MICMFRVKELKKDTHGSFNIRPQTVLTTSTGTDRIMSSNGTSERLPKMDVEPGMSVSLIQVIYLKFKYTNYRNNLHVFAVNSVNILWS